MSAVSLGDGREPGQALRWTAVALLVAGVHAGFGWWIVGHPFAAAPPPGDVAGVTVDLEPLSVPVPPTVEPKPREESGPGPEKQVAEAPDAPSATPPTTAETPPPPAADPQPEAIDPPPVEAAVAPPPELPSPVLEQKPETPPPPIPAPMPEMVPPPTPTPSDAVLAPPPPPPRPLPARKVALPKPPRPAPPKADPREVARQEARDAQAEARQEAREEARREAKSEAAAAARAQRQATRAERAATAREAGGSDRESAAPTPVASGAALSTWQGEVQAHMNGYTPTSPNGASGTVKVAFTVDRNGRLTSAGVSSSSGDAELDRAALAAVRRASPVPPPPPGPIPRVVVPVHFR